MRVGQFIPSCPATFFCYRHKNSLLSHEWIELVVLEVQVIFELPSEGFEKNKQKDVLKPVLGL